MSSDEVLLKPGVADVLLRRQSNRGNPNLVKLARGFSLSKIRKKGITKYFFTPKKGVILPHNCNLQYSFTLPDTGHDEQWEFMAFLLLGMQVDVRRLAPYERKELKNHADVLSSDQKELLYSDKKMWCVDPRADALGNGAIRFLTQHMCSSQVIHVGVANKSGEHFRHRQYQIPKLPVEPDYVYHLYEVLRMAITTAYTHKDEADIELMLRGLGKGEAPYKTVYEEGLYRCCYPMCGYTEEDERMILLHYNRNHWQKQDKLAVLANYPKQQYLASCLTAGEPKSVARALENLLQNDRNPDIDYKIVRMAIKATMDYVGIKADSLTVPDYDYVMSEIAEGNYDIPKDSTTGPMPVSLAGLYDSEYIRVSNSGPKRITKSVMSGLTIKIIKMLVEHVRTKKAEELEMEMLREFMPLCVASLMTKVETKTESEDREKIRLFFMAGGLDYMLAMVVLSPIFKNFNHGPGVMIGHKWFDADGSRLTNILEQYEYIYYFDYSKFDMTLKATILCYIMAFLLTAYESSDPDGVNFKVTMCLFLYLADRSAVKFVEWLDGRMRMMIGFMASGFYDTSYVDCLYTTFTFFGTMLKNAKTVSQRYYVAQQIRSITKRTENSKKPLNPAFFFGAYGDNGIAGMTNEMKEFASLAKLEEFARVNMKMTIKFKSACECKTPYSHLDEADNLILEPWRDPSGTVHMDKPSGIIYLKKTPVWASLHGEEYLIWHRPLGAYLARIGRTTVDIRNPAIEYMRLTNNRHDMCYAQRVGAAIYEAVQETLHLMIPTMMDWLETSLTKASEDSEFRKMFWKMQNRCSADLMAQDLIQYDFVAGFRDYQKKAYDVAQSGEDYYDLLEKRGPVTVRLHGLYLGDMKLE